MSLRIVYSLVSEAERWPDAVPKNAAAGHAHRFVTLESDWTQAAPRSTVCFYCLDWLPRYRRRPFTNFSVSFPANQNQANNA